MINIGCVIMAAGRSLRFGGDKLHAGLGGIPVVEHALKSAARFDFSRRVCVGRGEETRHLAQKYGIPFIYNHDGPQSQTVKLGISVMGDDIAGCMFLMGDQPFVSKDSLKKMAGEFEAHPDAVIRLAWAGEGGSPVIFPKRLFEGLLALEGERGGMYAASAAGAEIRLVEAELEQELWDIDTKEALEKAERYLKDGPFVET